MPRNKLREYTTSSEGSRGNRGAGRVKRAEPGKSGGRLPEIKPRSRRLLQEALEFLAKAERGRNPEGALKALFALYEEVDPYADYIKPGEREFFPLSRNERTLERFLEGFRYVYYILKRAQERIHLSKAFSNFWERCTEYLAKCGYSRSFISGVCAKDSLFYRRSFNYWREEFKDSEEALGVMFEYWKACFGIEGNDDYCAMDFGNEVTYDWRRMKACRERLFEEERREVPEYEPPVYEAWSEESRKLIRDRIERYRREREESMRGAKALLSDIRRRNKERGLFQDY